MARAKTPTNNMSHLNDGHEAVLHTPTLGKGTMRPIGTYCDLKQNPQSPDQKTGGPFGAGER